MKFIYSMATANKHISIHTFMVLVDYITTNFNFVFQSEEQAHKI